MDLSIKHHPSIMMYQTFHDLNSFDEDENILIQAQNNTDKKE